MTPLLSWYSARQPPLTSFFAAMAARVSPERTTYCLPVALLVTLRVTAVLRAVVDFFADDFVADDFFADDFLADDEVPPVLVPLYCFDEPAFLPHTGHAPMPWPSSTRSAMAICCARLALFAVLAY